MDARKVIQYHDIPGDTPLWHNTCLDQLLSSQDSQFWSARGIFSLKQLYSSNYLVSFTLLQEQYKIPRQSFYKYLQLHHALDAQWGPTRSPISSYPLIGIIRSQGPGGLISSIYSHLITKKVTNNPLPVIDKWKQTIPDLLDEAVSDILESHTLVSPEANNKLIQLYIVHQCYLMPSHLHKMGRLDTPSCLHSGHNPANFWHMIWECSVIKTFWREIITFLSEILGRDVPGTPDVCLFNITDEDSWSYHSRIMIRESLFLARKTIALRWMDKRPPRIVIWKNLVNKNVLFEKVVYAHRHGPGEAGLIIWSWRGFFCHNMGLWLDNLNSCFY